MNQTNKDLNRRKRIFEIIQIGQKEDLPSRLFDYFIVMVILLNILVLFLETFDQLSAYFPIMNGIEVATMLVFCIEYLLRIWTADCLYENESKGKAIIRFIFSFDGIIMLLTILPFFFLSGFVVFRILRVVRIFHLFRINANYDSIHVITSVLYEKRNQILSSIFIIMILMLASSLCMYSVEHNRQPEAFSNALSGIWWSMSTIFTVGYGDIYPVTLLGRVMALIITFLGVGAVAIPTGIISAGFVEQYTEMQRQDSLEAGTRKTVSVSVEEDNPFLELEVKEIENKYNISIAIIVRQGTVLLPSDNLEIQKEDIVVYQTL
jgi:voltage-gated potassium channel